MVADVFGSTLNEAHECSMQRMIQVGVVPVTWQQVMLEWQRDWARHDTYDAGLVERLTKLGDLWPQAPKPRISGYIRPLPPRH